MQAANDSPQFRSESADHKPSSGAGADSEDNAPKQCLSRDAVTGTEPSRQTEAFVASAETDDQPSNTTSPVYVVTPNGTLEIAGDDLAALQLSSVTFLDAFSDPFPDRLDSAVALFAFYPTLVAALDPIRPSEAGTSRRQRLNYRYFRAVEILVEAAERRGLDGSDIYKAAKLCRELFGDAPSEFLVRPDRRFPECFGAAFSELSPERRGIIDAAERTLVRLVARGNLEPASPPNPSAAGAAIIRDASHLTPTGNPEDAVVDTTASLEQSTFKVVPIRLKIGDLGERAAQLVATGDAHHPVVRLDVSGVWHTAGLLTTADSALVSAAMAPQTGEPAAAAESTRKNTKQKGTPHRKSGARFKIIGGLTAHHQYANGKCRHFEAIRVKKAAGEWGVSAGSISGFLKSAFGDFDRYVAACRQRTTLDLKLTAMNGDFAELKTAGRNPLAGAEGARHEDD